jgi:pilus assembly protein Flp/PilA
MKTLPACLHEDDAVTAIEYALLAGLLAIVLVLSITLLGGQVGQLFLYIKDQLVLAIS